MFLLRIHMATGGTCASKCHDSGCSEQHLAALGREPKHPPFRTSVHEEASVSEHLLEWLVNVLPTGFCRDRWGCSVRRTHAADRLRMSMG